ncbi:MAG: roadblock/LC7 domain-containing protein [Euryarchaeota archaeon]|nr:roadblock/LC7 domain-containing protein [Euryarchaeota archaeon]
MQDAKSVENILEDIIHGEFPQVQSIQSVSIVSKTGLMVAGRAASSARAETFSAMAAIMFSAAEATKKDVFRDKIDYVLAVFRNTKLFITELSSSLLIVATVNSEVEDSKILESMNQVVTTARERLVWLR